MTDYTELKRLAEAATPGPWYQHGGIMQVLSHDCETVCETFEDDGECPDAQFIAAANPAAVLALIAENERLSAIFARPQNMNAKPADDYETLKKQFGALKTYAACQEKMRDHYRASAEKLSKLDRSQSAEEIGAERSVNEQLTNDLLKTEDERDQLKAENEALRKIISDSATSCGAAVSVECTLDFMKHLPVEIFTVISKLRNALAECADSLHGEMLQKFGGQLPDDMHPVTRREYDRDMAEVAGCRVALGRGEQS